MAIRPATTPKCILKYTKSTINSALNYSKLQSTKPKAVSYLAVVLYTKITMTMDYTEIKMPVISYLTVT
jgi:hypothetical protein